MNFFIKHKDTQKSFTLIELLVVIAIIGILAGVLIVSITNASKNADDAKRKADINQLVKALLIYNTSHPNYPISGTACNIGSSCPVEVNAALGNGINARDPKGGYYKYSSVDGSSFIVTAVMSDLNTYSYDSSTSLYTTSTPNGVCGSASSTEFAFTNSSYGTNTFCSTGSPTPSSPAFPVPGGTASWVCSGGTPASCSASRQGLLGWNKRKLITVASSSALSNYQVKLIVTYDSDMQADFDDLRFTSSDSKTELNYWIESKTDSSTATVWIKVPSLVNGNSSIYMYYGNNSIASTSNGNNVFEFFDDFSGSSLNSSKWTTGSLHAGGGTVLSNGVLNVYSTNGYNTTAHYVSIPTFGVGYSTRSRTNLQSTGAEYQITVFGWYASNTNRHSFQSYHGQKQWCVSSTCTSGASFTTGSYGIFEVKRLPNGYSQLYFNDTLIASPTIISTSSEPISFSCRDDEYDVFSDWVLVRKVADTEPTSSFGGEE